MRTCQNLTDPHIIILYGKVELLNIFEIIRYVSSQRVLYHYCSLWIHG